LKVLVVSSTPELGTRMMEASALAFPGAERRVYIDPLLVVKHNQSWNADLVVCEFSLSIIDGIQLIKLLRKQDRGIAAVLLEKDGAHSRDADNLDIPHLREPEPEALKQIWESETA